MARPRKTTPIPTTPKAPRGRPFQKKESIPMTSPVDTKPIDEGVPNPPLVIPDPTPPPAPVAAVVPDSAAAKVAALRKELGGDKFGQAITSSTIPGIPGIVVHTVPIHRINEFKERQWHICMPDEGYLLNEAALERHPILNCLLTRLGGDAIMIAPKDWFDAKIAKDKQDAIDEIGASGQAGTRVSQVRLGGVTDKD